MKRGIIASLLTLSALASPAFAGGGGSTGTYTSYDRPITRDVSTGPQAVLLPGLRANNCCDCNGVQSYAMSVAAGPRIVMTPGQSKTFYVWGS